MKKIIVETVTTNSYKETTYNGFKYLSEALADMFEDHGEFYKEMYGVERADADAAGWHPDHRDFSRECSGFKQALADNFRITKTIVREEYSVEEIIEKLYKGE